MAMEVMRPQDCLADRFRAHAADVFPRRKSFNGGGRNGRSGRKQVAKLEKKRNGPTEPMRSKSAGNLRSSCRNNDNCCCIGGGVGGGLVSGHVTILRRGESLDSRIRRLEMRKQKEQSEAEAMMLYGLGRLGPEPEAVPREKMKAFLTGRMDVYAGSGFVVSPSPNDLPLPSFPKKKAPLSPVVVDDSATRNLRRLLRLE